MMRVVSIEAGVVRVSSDDGDIGGPVGRPVGFKELALLAGLHGVVGFEACE